MSSEALKPCPFCGSPKIDPEGWSRSDGVTGPACDDCGASAESVAQWNSTGIIAEIGAERKRQIEAEGWTREHDDAHADGEMSMAAATYAVSDKIGSTAREPYLAILWPWSRAWWKPKDRRRDLIRAAALIVAEIERLDRRAEKAKQGGA